MWPRPLTLPSDSKPDAAPVRLIVRRVKPAPGSQLALIRLLQLSRLHHRPGRGHPGTGGRPSPPRRDRERHPRPQVRRGSQPSPLGPLRRQRRLAGRPGAGPQLARWTARIGLGEQIVTTKTLRRTVLLPGRTAHPLGPPPHFASAPALALGSPVQSRPGKAPILTTPCLTPLFATDPTPPNSRPPAPRAHPAASNLTIPRFPAFPDRSRSPARLLKTLCRVTSVPMEPTPPPLQLPHPNLPGLHASHRWIRAKPKRIRRVTPPATAKTANCCSSRVVE